MVATYESRRPALPDRHGIGTWLRERTSGLVALAVVIGVGAGLGAIVFRWLVQSFTRVLSGTADYSVAGGVAHPWLPALGPWFVLFTPVIAGLVYGPLVQRFAPEARGHGVPEVMYAVAEHGGRIPAKVSFVKALASALCIGSGGSVGREGPIVQIGSALGSSLGRRVRLPESRLRVLVACGAAGGIAATFNAPLTGPFFAMELILSSFAVDSFAAVVVASVTASVIGRAVLGNEAFLELPKLSLTGSHEYLLIVLLGVLAGALGIGFSRVLYLVEDLCDRLWRGPEWLRPAVGGLLVGGILLVLPEMYGVGYPVLQNAIGGKYAVAFLLLLVVGKMLATSLTIGVGGSGGVFAPSLFIGGMAGTAFGAVVHELMPGATAAPGVYGMIGMGAAFAGAARAPITAVIVLFELTGEYSIILPLMAAIVIATLVSRAMSKGTIYTLKLRRRGVDLEASRATWPLTSRGVHGVVQPLPEALRAEAELSDAAQQLALSGYGVLPVVDPDGEYRGCVTTRAVAQALGAQRLEPGGEDPRRLTGDLAELPPLITDRATLAEALDALASAPGGALPVLDESGRELSGWLTHRRVLGALREVPAS
ncbi:chloride channel protein [Saccharopolyspora sp. SCSIO 74807]|uniref:chloride channel protein n=1 Tax=Saccharopolyspora sp. SCSIO 74807 TaxID=3118084 RepID=UPI0030D3E885